MELLMIDDYQAGACNIGPAEIAARRRFGHAGAAVTAGLLALLLLTGAPAVLRVVLFLPAAGAAAGYLQAATHFCADYGWRGVFNLGTELRRTSRVEDPAARAADRRKAALIGVASAAIGLAVVALSLAV
jgi:hypothetical protein